MTATATKLSWHYAATARKVRQRLAWIIGCLRTNGSEVAAGNATGALRKLLVAGGVPADVVDGSKLGVLLKQLEDEQLVERDVNGRRCTAIRLTDAGVMVDLEHTAWPAETSDPGDTLAGRLLQLQDHLSADHPAVWANLEALERTSLRRLEETHNGLTCPVPMKGRKKITVDVDQPATPTPRSDDHDELATIQRIAATMAGAMHDGEESQTAETDVLDLELAALRTVRGILDELPQSARARVTAWATAYADRPYRKETP